MNLTDLRKDYTRDGLRESDLDPEPIRQFAIWFDQAKAIDSIEPNAMTLATATAEGFPSARIVLLKGYDARGFTFFTSYDGRKAAELEVNPRAALLFYWAELERQIRIEGIIQRTTPEESSDYFANRPRGSQLGAWASHQSIVIGDRSVLEAKLAEVMARFGEGEVPCPPFWGGYRVVPTSLEFWQGRLNRLHDRLRYRLDDGRWIIERLSP